MRPRIHWLSPSSALFLFAAGCFLDRAETDGAAYAESGSSGDAETATSSKEQAETDYQTPLAAAAEAGSCHTADCCTLATVVLGTQSADTLTGGGGSECLVGLAGRDTLNGNGGGDEILAGDGDDTLNGGQGNNTLAGGLGDA